MRKLFEKWVVTHFGKDWKESLKGFDEENGYPNEVVNAMWVGFNGYAIISEQV